MDVFETIKTQARGLQKDMVACRRDFHRYAESGWLEMRTASIIARKLTDLGYEVLIGEEVCLSGSRMGVPEEALLESAYRRAAEQGADPEFLEKVRHGHTGVIGILRCGEGPTVAMRFDIDALGVHESTDEEHVPYREGFASVNPGSMHACGHDAHGTIGLGVAQVLRKIQGDLHGTVKLIFQPAEEGVRGAKSIVDAGHLDGVDYVIGSHVTGRKPGQDFDLYPGSYGSLATCKYDVVFRGLSAHAGGAPQEGRNALLAAANAVMNLYAIPRHSHGASRINVGTLVAGSGRNVIADEAKMEIEVRGANTQINDYMCQYALRILENAAAMHGCTCSVEVAGATGSIESDSSLAKRLDTMCREKLGMTTAPDLMLKLGGSEDFAYMLNRVQEQGGQGTFLRILTDFAGPAHNRRFDIGEDVLWKAVQVFCGAAAELMQK